MHDRQQLVIYLTCRIIFTRLFLQCVHRLFSSTLPFMFMEYASFSRYGRKSLLAFILNLVYLLPPLDQ